MADEKDVVEKTIAEDLVVTKYKMAGEIVNSEFYSCAEFVIFVHAYFVSNNGGLSCNRMFRPYGVQHRFCVKPRRVA